MKIEEDNLLKIILNNTEEGIAVIDKNGIFTHYNSRISDIEGVDREKVIGKYLLDVFPLYDRECSSMLICLKEGKPIFNQLQKYFNKDGDKIFSIVTDIPIISNGSVVGAVEFVKDVDKIKNLYKSISRYENNIKKKNSNRNSLNKQNHYNFSDFLTKDPELKKTVQNIKNIYSSHSNILIYGETGTGKEIIAQSIHNSSDRRDRPCVVQNCAAIPENLLESILFGTSKGSFTGATQKEGLFQQANGGTLFLDELNSMPIHLQPKILRAIEDGCIRKVGSREINKVDVRVISTINVDPEILIEKNILRNDLFYRLNQIFIEIPPLRKRKVDICFLANHFLKLNNDISNKNIKISKEVLDMFNRYEWKGNVRELRNVIEYSINLLQDEDEIKIKHLPYYLNRILKKQDFCEDNSINSSYKNKVDSFEKELIKKALVKSKGNISKASRQLNIKRQTLHHKIKKFNIDD